MKKLLIFGFLFLTVASLAFAGNPERTGQAGATQLLINSWGRSSGLNGINIGGAYGIESVINNPAGLATTRRTELVFSHTRYLVGTDININSFGVSQALKNSGVIGIYVTAFDLGSFPITTEDNPDGTLGDFSPTFLNLGLSYGRKFTDHIYVGATLKLVQESIFDVGATGVAFDAGVQYRTSFNDDEHADRLKLGVSLRNIGSTMRYGGDGLTFRSNRNENFTSLSSRPTAEFEMPSVLSLGVSYDFYFGDNRFTPMGAFISNAFALDNIGIGAEVEIQKYIQLRYSFLYERGIFDPLERLSAWTGHAVGMSVQVPFKSGKDKKSDFALDYSYRTTDPFSGTHSIGVRIDL